MTTEDPWDRELDASTVSGGHIAGRDRQQHRLPALTVIAHPDIRRIGARVLLPELVSGRQVELSRATPTFAQPGSDVSPRPLADPRLSRRPLRLTGAAAGALQIVRGDHRGDCHLDGEPLGDERSIDLEALNRGVVLELAGRLALLLHRASPTTSRTRHGFGLVGASHAIDGLRAEIGRVGPLDLSVLLLGESGTGKELTARALHDAGPRRHGPFVAVNMAAIPASLAASELFGVERGAFTGADRRRLGAFRRADRGTLFLDEIGAAPGEIQDLLLRALESGEVQSVGADRPRAVDVRVVAATDADLDKQVDSGRFRLPLLHRLSAWVIEIPPLRERRDDVARLLVHFLQSHLDELDAGAKLDDPGPRGEPWLPASLVTRLTNHPWPGNVRQLANVARQLAIGCHDQPRAVLSDRLEREIEPTTPAPSPSEPEPQHAPRRPRRTYRPPRDVTDDELVEALRAHRWRLKPTAASLDVSRTSLYSLIDRCPRIRKAADLDIDEITAALKSADGDPDSAAANLEVSPHGLLLRLRELDLDSER